MQQSTPLYRFCPLNIGGQISNYVEVSNLQQIFSSMFSPSYLLLVGFRQATEKFRQPTLVQNAKFMQATPSSFLRLTKIYYGTSYISHVTGSPKWKRDFPQLNERPSPLSGQKEQQILSLYEYASTSKNSENLCFSSVVDFTGTNPAMPTLLLHFSITHHQTICPVPAI